MTTTADARRGEKGAARRVRWRYLINARLQMRYIGVVVALEALVLAVIAWAVFVVVWQPLVSGGTEAAAQPGAREAFAGMTRSARQVTVTALGLFVVFGVVCAAVGLVMSHGVAGPLRRVEDALRTAAETGTYRHRVRLRRGDSLRSLADEVNVLLARLDEQQRDQQDLLRHVAEVAGAVADALERGQPVPQDVLDRTQELEGLTQRALLSRRSA